jgi:hypothetical protein
VTVEWDGAGRPFGLPALRVVATRRAKSKRPPAAQELPSPPSARRNGSRSRPRPARRGTIRRGYPCSTQNIHPTTQERIGQQTNGRTDTTTRASGRHSASRFSSVSFSSVVPVQRLQNGTNAPTTTTGSRQDVCPRRHRHRSPTQNALNAAMVSVRIGSACMNFGAPACPTQHSGSDTQRRECQSRRDAKRSFPESLTSTADGTIILGSLDHGTIYRAPKGSTKATPWIAAGPNGLERVLGVFTHDASNTLWVCTNTTDPQGKDATLKAFDLAAGTSKASYPFPDGGLCNDIDVSRDGTVLATDTRGGRILRSSQVPLHSPSGPPMRNGSALTA